MKQETPNKQDSHTIQQQRHMQPNTQQTDGFSTTNSFIQFQLQAIGIVNQQYLELTQILKSAGLTEEIFALTLKSVLAELNIEKDKIKTIIKKGKSILKHMKIACLSEEDIKKEV